MFYSQFILAKKGPLGTIWIAAHLERKLRKNQVSDTDIGVSVDSILFPDIPIALRLSSHLLLGVVRIYSRKVNYLFDDCSEALLKIKQAFRSTAVDLPPEESTAPYHSITLPETFDLDDFELPDSDIFQGNYVDHHVSTKEQITLQDSMEGMVYSATQFGLDERFGDGDTSGLDLDEELFLNKVTAPGPAAVMLGSHAEHEASVQPMTPLDQDKNHEGSDGDSEELVDTSGVNQLAGLAGNTDFIEYAQAPSTPGLVEEPNLSKIQEASACDDHLELGEEPNLSNVQDAWEINQLKSWGDSPSTAGDLSAEPVKAIFPVSPDRNFTAGANRVEDLRNEAASNNVPSAQSIDGAAHADRIEPQGVRLDETASCANFVHEECVFEDPSGKSCTSIENISEMSSLSSTCQPASECILEINQASLRTELSNNVENAGDMEESCFPGNAVPSNTEPPGRQDIENPETLVCQDPKDSKILTTIVHAKMAAANIHVLQPCNLNHVSTLDPGCDISVAPYLPSGVTELNSLQTSGRKEALNAAGASIEVQGEGFHPANIMKPVLEENHATEPASCEDIQADFSKLNDQVHNVISGDTQLEKLDGPENSELPAPEKLLSVPEGLADVQDNLLVESTPDKAHFATGYGDDAGINNIILGKKRSFTESTLTFQSLNSVESLGVAQSEKTKESVPDDDDLLSSILVGRRSSVLKMKPTPPPPEKTRMKRSRSAPRVSASKRKVLMDDTMVLHGDVIRQQLTTTEDIRRIRKKAPCTRPEIWMIQKEFLEDEIFSEPIFTGLSTKLHMLHGQTYDLSKIRVCENNAHDGFQEAAVDLNLVSKRDENNPSEGANDLEFFMEPNINNETGAEVIKESTAVRNDGEAEPPENQHSEEHVLQSQGYDTLMSAGSMLLSSLLDNENGGYGSLQMDASGLSSDQKLDPESVEMDSSVVYISSGKGVDAIKVAEENDAGAAVGGTESGARDECLLEEAEVRASVEIGADMQIGCSAHIDHENPSLAFSSETDRSSNQVVTIEQAMEEIKKTEQGVVNEDEVLAAELDYDGKNITAYGSSEEPKVASPYPVESNVYVNDASLNDGEYLGRQEADLQCAVDAEIDAFGHTHTEDHVDFDYTIDGHDTGFLNADDDDDDVAEEDDDYVPSAEQTSFFENSGWSSRTRAVAKYLQVLFDKEAEHGRKVLPIDNLLVGKTRKEASRMFFEALVLKTRDYIHVEQETPFDNINIKPRAKLMKSDF